MGTDTLLWFPGNPPIGTDTEWSAMFLPPVRAAFQIITNEDEFRRVAADPELQHETLAAMVATTEEMTRVQVILRTAVRRLIEL